MTDSHISKAIFKPLLLLSICGQPQDILLKEDRETLRRSSDFFMNIQTVIFKEFFSFINFTFATRM